MADLIIKPTSGNLLIKDDQDATRMTVATSTGATTLTNQVFPAGHVIKHWNIVRPNGATQRTQTLNTTATIVDLNGALSITGVTATENNYLRITFGGMSFRAVADNTYSTFFETHDGSNVLSTYEFYFDQQASDNLTIPITLTSIVTVPANFTNKTVSFRAYMQNSNPGTLTLYARATGSVVTSPFLSIDEIQV